MRRKLAALLLCLLAGCRTETEKTALTEGELDELSENCFYLGSYSEVI